MKRNINQRPNGNQRMISVRHEERQTSRASEGDKVLTKHLMEKICDRGLISWTRQGALLKV